MARFNFYWFLIAIVSFAAALPNRTFSQQLPNQPGLPQPPDDADDPPGLQITGILFLNPDGNLSTTGSVTDPIVVICKTRNGHNVSAIRIRTNEKSLATYRYSVTKTAGTPGFSGPPYKAQFQYDEDPNWPGYTQWNTNWTYNAIVQGGGNGIPIAQIQVPFRMVSQPGNSNNYQIAIGTDSTVPDNPPSQ